MGMCDHRLDVYDRWLHLAYTPKQWAKLTARFEQHIDQPGMGAVTSVRDTNPPAGEPATHYLIWIDKQEHDGQPAALVNTIAHEASHVAGQIFDDIGEQPSNNTETRAYLVGWIAQWIWERVA